MNDLLKKAAIWSSMSMFVIGTISTSSTFRAYAEEDEYEECDLGSDPECEPIPCDQPTGLLDSSATPCTMANQGKGKKKKPKGANCFLGDNGCEEKGDGCPEGKTCRKGEGEESGGCACRLPKKSPSPKETASITPTDSPTPDATPTSSETPPTPEPPTPVPSSYPTYY